MVMVGVKCLNKFVQCIIDEVISGHTGVTQNKILTEYKVESVYKFTVRVYK